MAAVSEIAHVEDLVVRTRSTVTDKLGLLDFKQRYRYIHCDGVEIAFFRLKLRDRSSISLSVSPILKKYVRV